MLKSLCDILAPLKSEEEKSALVSEDRSTVDAVRSEPTHLQPSYVTTKGLPGQNCMNRARPVQTAHHKTSHRVED